MITDWSPTSRPFFGVSIFPLPFPQNQALFTQFHCCVEPADKAKPSVMMGPNAAGISPRSAYKDDKIPTQGGIIC